MKMSFEFATSNILPNFTNTVFFAIFQKVKALKVLALDNKNVVMKHIPEFCRHSCLVIGLDRYK